MSEFFDAFNAALPEIESEFGEDWIFGSASYPAIAIDKLAVGSKVMRGGQLLDVSTMIFIRDDVFDLSGVKKGSIVTTRGSQLAVLEIDDDGDASKTLICGPSQIDVFG